MSDIADKTANVSITNNDETKTVDVITDGSVERLAVDAAITVNTAEALAIAGKAYSIVIDFATIAVTGETPIFLLKNGAASGKIARVLNIEYTTNVVNFVFRAYRDPTITSDGTALSLVNFKKGGASAVTTAFKFPTISANGTILRSHIAYGKAIEKLVSPDIIRPISPGENWLLTTDCIKDFSHSVKVDIAEIDE